MFGEARQIYYCWDCDSYFSETKRWVKKKKPAIASEGWTVVLMDRASRFIWELECGPRETDLFQQAKETLAQVIEQLDYT